MKISSVVFIVCIIFNNATAETEKRFARDPFFLSPSAQILDERYAYPVSQLKLVALIHQGEKSLIQLSDPKKHFYTLKKGDCIGVEKAKITEITSSNVTISWMAQGQLFTDKLS